MPYGERAFSIVLAMSSRGRESLEWIRQVKLKVQSLRHGQVSDLGWWWLGCRVLKGILPAISHGKPLKNPL
jgi:hypothetical protein